MRSILHKLLWLYPVTYRKKFGQEIEFIVLDMQEEAEQTGASYSAFLIAVGFDIIRSAIAQHISLVKSEGVLKYMKKTLPINTYNIWGAVLLLPIFLVFTTDVVSRILQGDLFHYNRQVYSFLSHTFFYQTQVLFIWVILFPLFAALLNVIPVLKNISKKRQSFFKFAFIRQNALSIVILFVGLFFITLIKLHDFAPCFVHGLWHVGILQIPRIYSFCQNA